MASEIGSRLRALREARGKSEAVIAGLAGISPSYLHHLETGERALDRWSLIVALAKALHVAPSELIGLPVPGPADRHADEAEHAVRLALMAVHHGHPNGLTLPAETLRQQVEATVSAMCLCEEKRVGRELPGLIRNLHTSITAGRDVATLLDLAVLLHSQATVAWLRFAGAPVDLCAEAALLARRAAEHRDTPTALGLATASTSRVMIMAGAFDLADLELDSVTVPTNTPEAMQLAGFRALRKSTVAAAAKRLADVAAPLEYATELAERTGEGNAYSLAFGPLNVGLFRMAGLLEIGDHATAVAVAEGLHPEVADRSRQSYFWADYGRALARVRGRRTEAAAAFLKAEALFPHRVHRDPFARSVIVELITRAQEDTVSRDLRLCYRAGMTAVA